MRKVRAPYILTGLRRDATTSGGKLQFQDYTRRRDDRGRSLTRQPLDQWKDGVSAFVNKALSGRFRQLIDTSHWPELEIGTEVSNVIMRPGLAHGIRSEEFEPADLQAYARVRNRYWELNTSATDIPDVTVLLRSNYANGTRLDIGHGTPGGAISKTTTVTVRGGFVVVRANPRTATHLVIRHSSTKRFVGMITFQLAKGDVAGVSVNVGDAPTTTSVARGLQMRPHVGARGRTYPPNSLVEITTNSAANQAIQIANISRGWNPRSVLTPRAGAGLCRTNC